MYKLTSWLFTPLFYLGFALVLLIFELEFRIGQLLGRPSFNSTRDRLHYCLTGLLKLIACPIEVSGRKNIRDDKNYLFLCNHQSMFDLTLLFTALAPLRPVFVPKKELARGIPSISFVINRDGSAIIDRKNPKQSLRALAELGKRTKEQNLSVILFPAGTRSSDGSVGSYKHAGLSSLLKSAGPELKVIPTYLHGPAKLVRGFFKPVGSGTKLSIVFGNEIDQSSFEGGHKAMVKEVEKWTIQQQQSFNGKNS